MLISAYLDATTEVLKQGWCQGAASRGADGANAPMDEAVAWCLDGALYKVQLGLPKNTGYIEYKNAGDFLDRQFQAMGTRMIAFNDKDGQTQDGVVAFVTNAANKARAVEIAEAEAAVVAAATAAQGKNDGA